MTEFAKEMRKRFMTEQKLGYIPLAQAQSELQTKFLQELKAKEEKYIKARKPFCYKCARVDFEIEWNRQIKELEISAGYARGEKIEPKEIDLDKYGSDSYFEFIKESETLQRANFAKGEKARMVKYKDYICKRGHKHSVEILEDEKEVKAIVTSKK